MYQVKLALLVRVSIEDGPVNIIVMNVSII